MTEAVILAGWLEKKGHIIKNWKRRYTILEGNELSYHTDETLRNKKGSIQLDQSTKVQIRDGSTHSWKFRIISNGKHLELSAGSENERDLWVTTIRDHIQSMNGLNGSSVYYNKRRTTSVGSSITPTDSITIYTTNDSDQSDDSDDESSVESLSQQPLVMTDFDNLPDIPLDILPDLNDLICK